MYVLSDANIGIIAILVHFEKTLMEMSAPLSQKWVCRSNSLDYPFVNASTQGRDFWVFFHQLGEACVLTACL